MAETAAIVCPLAPDLSGGVHCWHTVWTPSHLQQGQFDGHEMRCCWCGDNQPLTFSYTPPKAHGKHAPDNPTGQLGGFFR